MNAGWDAQQREWLQALGYEVMVPVAAQPERVEALEAPPPVPAAMAPRPAEAVHDDPLARALARAARCEGPARLAGLQLDLAALRRDPGAKRALWPRLRALRKVGR